MKKIIVYSKPNCIQCEMTKKELTKLGADFVVEDLLAEKNAEILAGFKAQGYRNAPIVTIEEIVISGFDPIKLRSALK